MKRNELSPIILNGLSVSKGIAIGKCKIIEHGQRNIEKLILKNNEDIKKELLKFDNAHKSTLDELKKIRDKIKSSVQKNIILFLDTHILLINDKAGLPYKKIWISLDNFQERKVEKHFINEGNLEIHDFYYEKYIKTPSNVLYASVVKHHIDKNISSKTTIYSLESNYGLYNNIFEID